MSVLTGPLSGDSGEVSFPFSLLNHIPTSQQHYHISVVSMTAITMDVDGLDNPERAQLLSVVDKFRTIGISKEISLPQASPLRQAISIVVDSSASCRG